MTDAAFAAEDTIESYYVHQVLATSTGNNTASNDIFSQDLEKAIIRMDLIIQEVVEIKEEHGENDDQRA